MKTDIDTAHEFRGDLYREGEERADLLKRIKAHLAEAFPGMNAAMRFGGDWYHSSLTVSILGYPTADLSVREEGSAARRLINAELKRFTRHDWEPHHGLRNVSLYTSTRIDPSLHAAALRDAPSLQPRLSFAEFTRQARPGDVLEHIAGVVPHQGARVEIVAISSRRLTTRAADGPKDGDARRTPIQGGACFVSDGETVCFRHSGFASAGGYSHMRWLRGGLIDGMIFAIARETAAADLTDDGRQWGDGAMCRTILTAGPLEMPDEVGPRGEVQRFVNLGERSRVVARRWGRGGLGIEWMDMTLGITSKSTDTRMTYVAIDRAEMLRGFADDLATRLCAIPMYGCRWRSGGEWTKVAPGWALGFFDDDQGFLIAAAVDDGRPRPVVADWPDAREWLMSEKWEQLRLLRAAADRPMMDA